MVNEWTNELNQLIDSKEKKKKKKKKKEEEAEE